MGNSWLFASVDVEASVNNVLERAILVANLTINSFPQELSISTNLVIVGLWFVHHSSDPIVNNGCPHNSPLGDRDPIPGLLSVRIKHELESNTINIHLMRHFMSVGTVKTPALPRVVTTESHFASTSFTVNWLTVSSKFSLKDFSFLKRTP